MDRGTGMGSTDHRRAMVAGPASGRPLWLIWGLCLLLIPPGGRAGGLLSPPLFEVEGSYESVVGRGDLFFLAARDPDPEQPDIRIFRVTGGNGVREIGTYFTVGATLGMALKGDYLFLANGDGGLEVVDVGNPARPVQVAELPLDGYTHRVRLGGRFAYLASGFGGLYIVDVADPGRPQLIGTYRAFAIPRERPQAQEEPDGLFPGSGDAPPVAATPYPQDYYEADDLPAYEGPEPDTPPQEFADREGLIDLAVGKGRVYLAYASAGLQVVDVRNPGRPVLLGTLDLGGPVETVRLDGGRLQLTAGIAGVRIVDVSSPARPRPLGELRTICYPQDLAGAGRYTYVADGYCGSDGLLVMDNSGPQPKLLESHPGIVGNVGVAGGRLFAMGLNTTRVYALPR